jgi:hypothetical protein
MLQARVRLAPMAGAGRARCNRGMVDGIRLQ